MSYHTRYAATGWTGGPIEATGCKLHFAGGIVGISNTLNVFDGESCVARQEEISPAERAALADHMIGLWKKFAGPVE